MSTASKLFPILLLLAALGGGAYYFISGQNAEVAAPPGTGDPSANETTPRDPQPRQPEPPIEVQTGESNAGGDQDPVRIEAGGELGSSHADAPQGVQGRVLRPDGTPARGAAVVLVKSAMSDPLQIFIDNKAGRTQPPLASTVTDDNGTFALGVLKAGQQLDLRVVSDEFPVLSRGNLKVRSGDWYDTGDLKLLAGRTVQGRVVDSETGAGIPGATVFLSSSNSSHAMVATPGRERGTPMQTDGNGRFRFTNGPTMGLVNLTAELTGYASTTLRNQDIGGAAASGFTLALDRGRLITGVVVDDTGKRISGVKVTATALSAKTPQSEIAVSGRDGEFEFPPLRRGPYRLTATAARYADVEVPVAMTDEDVKIVLERRGSVRLRVLSANDRPVKSYRLSLKRSFPNQPGSIGNVLDFPDRNISPRDYDGDWAVIDGMPAGTFRFQLTEREHAKTLSPEFVVKDGGDAIEVTAVLTLGAAITGTVIDGQGRPVAGATVSSDMNSGLAAQTGLFDVLRSMIPEKHTSRSVRTDNQGRFRIGRLSFADYMIRAAHPNYCEGTAINIKLDQEGQEVDAGVIQLLPGTIVEGITSVNGVPTGQVKVVISMPTDNSKMPTAAPKTPEEIREASRRLFSTNVISDGDGRYRMGKRVPPGTYKITASRHSQDNPFGALLDMKNSERQLVIAPGQERVVIDFSLSDG